MFFSFVGPLMSETSKFYNRFMVKKNLTRIFRFSVDFLLEWDSNFVVHTNRQFEAIICYFQNGNCHSQYTQYTRLLSINDNEIWASNHYFYILFFIYRAALRVTKTVFCRPKKKFKPHTKWRKNKIKIKSNEKKRRELNEPNRTALT